MDDRKCWHPSFFSWRNSAILCVGENNQKGAFSMCEDFNIFLLKLPEDCKEITTESCVQFHLPRKHHVCPICGSQHTYVHSYRSQNLCGLPTDTVYIYRKRRYRCQKCGKAFFEETRSSNVFSAFLAVKSTTLSRSTANLFRPHLLHADMESLRTLLCVILSER